MLRDADTLLAPAVTTTINALTLGDPDAALVRLTRRYAAAIDTAEDEGEALGQLGPKLLAALTALGATPAARARRTGEGGGSAGPNRLRALREARRA